MMSNALASGLTDGKPHSVEEITDASKGLMDAMAGKLPGVTRDPGMLVTTEDVRTVRRYVNKALQLPTELNEVKYLLGYEETDISGLEPLAIQRLYIDIKEHARTWSELETSMQKVGSDLYVFAGNLIIIANDMIKFVESLDCYRDKQLSGLSPEEIDRLPPVKLGENDRKKLPGLLALIDDLRVYIKDHSASTTRTRVGVTTFKRRMNEDLEPALALKMELAKAGDPDVDVSRLTEEAAHLGELIGQKLQEYEEYCDYKWIGFWWGVIPGVIALSIYGPKATAVLEEKDRLVKEKLQIAKDLEKLNRLAAGLLVIKSELTDLNGRIKGAISGISSIESLWVLLEDLVDDSCGRIKDIDNSTYLVSFVSRFQTLTRNWADIETRSFELLTAFNKALDEPVAR